MAPQETEHKQSEDEEAEGEEEALQYLYIIRHGDRFDYQNPEWSETSPRPGDPPLSQLGHQQARETGLFLNDLLEKDGIEALDVTWLSSPFLRCLQTSTEALHQLRIPNHAGIPILPEYSVFEWDGKQRGWHDSLPSLDERRHYFARLTMHHESLFLPTLPESRDTFLQRCQKVMEALKQRYPLRNNNNNKSVLVVVTHAAACIGLCKAALGDAFTFADINPAAPCGVYRLTRTTTRSWIIDACDKPESCNLNGHTAHLSSTAGRTTAWNHFGDKQHYNGYSGPTSSKFAPLELRRNTC